MLSCLEFESGFGSSSSPGLVQDQIQVQVQEQEQGQGCLDASHSFVLHNIRTSPPAIRTEQSYSLCASLSIGHDICPPELVITRIIMSKVYARLMMFVKKLMYHFCLIITGPLVLPPRQ